MQIINRISINRTRFAPSPTGYLHIGHVASAWTVWEDAGRLAENFILRIEDIDQARCRPEYETAIYEDLAWLGLSWPEPVRRQSAHFDAYRKHLDNLADTGLIYPCFCTRKEIEREIENAPSAPHGLDGPVYPQTCKNLSAAEIEEKIAAGQPYALRLDMQVALKQTAAKTLKWHDRRKGWKIATPDFLAQRIGDVVLARKDTPASYHLCVTHDDALQGIGLVTRGEDLFHSTHLHRLLQELHGWPVPDYHHHPLLADKSGRRFAKRDKSLTVRELRLRGYSPEGLIDMIKRGNTEDLLI